jgi:hypothetical protein
MDLKKRTPRPQSPQRTVFLGELGDGSRQKINAKVAKLAE